MAHSRQPSLRSAGEPQHLPRQLTETDFVSTILSRVADWRLSPGSLMFEITEVALSRDAVRARNAIKELCTLGMRVCFDDFWNRAILSATPHHVRRAGGQARLRTHRQDGRWHNGTGSGEIGDRTGARPAISVTAEGVESQQTGSCSRTRLRPRPRLLLRRAHVPPLLIDYLRERRTVRPRWRSSAAQARTERQAPLAPCLDCRRAAGAVEDHAWRRSGRRNLQGGSLVDLSRRVGDLQ